MNGEVKQKWIDALEGGEYKQGQSVLHAGGRFCCLGVLADLYVKEKDAEWQFKPDSMHNDLYELVHGDMHEYLDLPQEVQEWSGLDDSDPFVDGQRLSRLNDSLSLDFKQIAKRIREEL